MVNSLTAEAVKLENHFEKAEMSVASIKRKTSMQIFLKHRKAYFKNFNHNFSLTSRPETLKNLIDDGIAIIENFFSQSQIKEFLENIPTIEEMENNGISKKNRGLYTFEDVSNYSKMLSPFFVHPLIAEMAHAYLSPKAQCFRTTARYKTLPGKDSVNDFETFFHFDDWKHRFKGYLYLTDVDESSAPMIYLKGSHYGTWRHKKEYEMFSKYKNTGGASTTDPESKMLGCFDQEEIKLLKNQYSLKEFICIGKAGTLLFFDGRGLHQGTELINGKRIILTSSWR